MGDDPVMAALEAGELDPLFWHPARHGVDSAWYGHVPFAHWLVSVQRPASIVELGAHNGVSYAAFCDAVLRGKLDARAMAVDTWQGDEHAGFYGEDVYAELKHFHEQRYAAFSTLLRSTFDDALRFVPDGSVDLLHIDGRHRYEDVSHDFASWQVKLSRRAVVLLHDTNVHEGDFGVWRLFSELRQQYRNFEFLHGHGLGVLACGDDVAGPAASLCSTEGAGSTNVIRERFALLGDRWIAARDLGSQTRLIAHLNSEIERTTRQLAETSQWAQTAQEAVNTCFPKLQELGEQHRRTRADLAQARYDLAARDLQMAELRQQVEAGQAEVAARDAGIAAREAHIAGRDAEIAARDTGIAERDAGIAARDAEIAARDAALAAMRSVAGEMALKLQWAARDREALERERAVILSSTSWRLTAPVRRLLGGKPAPPLIAPIAQVQLPAPPAEDPAQIRLAGELPAPVEALEPSDLHETPVDESVLLETPVEEYVPHEAPVQAGTALDSAMASAERRTRALALFISGESHTPGHFYRIERYVEAARRLGYEARWMEPGPVGPADLEGVAFVMLWRVPCSAHIEGIITVTHEQGGLAIFDVDDLMFRPELATIRVIDGIRTMNLSELDIQNLFASMARTLRACDIVTCPTQELVRHARRLGRPAYVLPNGFDRKGQNLARLAMRRLADERDDLLRIGYAGGSRTHQRDFAVAVPALLRVLQETPNARLTLFRDPASGEGLVLIKEFPELAGVAAQIEWRDMVGLPDLGGEMARFAVNIAPLQHGNLFCESKSELKFFEAAVAGVPTIASPSGPFARAIIDGQTGFLAHDDEAWYAALTTLLGDAGLRHRVAQSAYHAVLAAFGPRSQTEALSHMLAQAKGGEAGVASFQRDRYLEALARPAPPRIVEHDVLFSTDSLEQAQVSVIVPVFNYADYVPEALASIAAQTLARLDLVVVEDCSPDDSADMVLDWVRAHAARFNRVVVLKHRQNAGLGLARNSGFAAAETEFILPLDADNRLRPTACETLLAALQGSGAAFAYPAIQEFGDKTGIFGQEPYSTLRLQIGNYIDAMALVRKSAWAEAGGYDYPQHGWEDFDFWCRLAELGRYGIAVPDILADYRVHGKSMLHTLTDIREHRAELCARLTDRHRWLDVA